jgi:hypothetical protein
LSPFTDDFKTLFNKISVKSQGLFYLVVMHRFTTDTIRKKKPSAQPRPNFIGKLMKGPIHLQDLRNGFPIEGLRVPTLKAQSALQ